MMTTSPGKRHSSSLSGPATLRVMVAVHALSVADSSAAAASGPSLVQL